VAKFVDDGQYLKSVDFYGGKFVDNLRLCRTPDDKCVGPFGGSLGEPINHVLKKDLSVIKSFMGTDGAVIDRLRAMHKKESIKSN